MNVWINIAAFQIGWFACVLGGAHGMPWLGTAIAAGVIAIHLYLASRPGNEALLIVFAAICGAVADTLLIRGGWLEFSSGIIMPGAPPHWIIALWMIFATTLNVSLNWLKARWLLAVAFGAVGGPLAYYAGARLGAVTFPETVPALIAVGAEWALVMPLLLWVADRCNGALHPRRAQEEAGCV